MSSVASLVEPAYRTAPEYWDTLGPEVADLNEMIGFAPDPEQRLALDLLFAVDQHGGAAVVELDVIAARQNLKTGFMKQAAIGWLFLTEERLIVWSAHEFSTAVEAHRDLTQLIEGSAWLSKRVKQIYNSAADKSIELTTGARLIFKARTKTGSRGLSAPKIFLDEGFALQPEHMGAIIPAQSAMANPQRVVGSSAGHQASGILRGMRDRGRAGRSSRQGYLEWAADREPCEKDACDHTWGTEGCALDRHHLWAAANTSLGRTRANGTGVTLQTIQDERESLPPEEFARERLSWWDESGAAEIFGAGRWDGCAADTPATAELGALAVAISLDLRHASIVGAGRVGLRTYVQPLQHGPGYDWTVDRLAELQQAHCVDVVLDGTGPTSLLIPKLQAAGIRFTLAKADVCDAFAVFFGLVITGDLMHDRDPDLEAAVDGATPQDVGDRRRWGRRKSNSDISALEGATLSAWLVARPVLEPPPAAALPHAIEPAAAAEDDIQTIGF